MNFLLKKEKVLKTLEVRSVCLVCGCHPGTSLLLAPGNSLYVGSPVGASSFFLVHALIVVEHGFTLTLEGIGGCQFLSLSGSGGVN